jgi:hypothetical protein
MGNLGILAWLAKVAKVRRALSKKKNGLKRRESARKRRVVDRNGYYFMDAMEIVEMKSSSGQPWDNRFFVFM